MEQNPINDVMSKEIKIRLLAKKFLFIFLFFFSGFIKAQDSDNFSLQGIIYGGNYQNIVGTIYLQNQNGKVVVRREFSNDLNDYTLTNAIFSKKEDQYIFEDQGFISKKLGIKNSLCKHIITLNIQDSLGYYRGTIDSKQCRNQRYDVICYNSDLPFNSSEKNTFSDFWVKNFVRMLAKGYPAPPILAERRAHFKLFTILFDYDKYDVRPEYTNRLLEMAMIVDSHSDYRIKITGFTDSDGSNIYNDTLSYHRAMSIKSFLVQKGVADSKIVIKFEGKRFPIADNKTSEGKQQNRRVIIEFI